VSINVVVSSTAAGVSVSGGTAVAISVAGSTAAAVTVGGGIGPAGFLINPGTATNAFGTFQLTAGDGITISTSAAQFQIASYGTTAVSSLAPVQSVAGRVGNIALQASDVTAGTFAVARIPTISYTALSNVPTSFSPSAHTHGTADIVGLTGSFAAASHTHDAAAVTSGVLELARIPTIGYTALAGVPATFAPQAHTHGTTDIVGYSAMPAGGYVQAVNGLTGTVTIAGGAGVTVSTASSSITIAAGGGGGSANIVEAATAAGFPATGASSTLYVATDASRVYRWAGSVYVELGASGGGSSSVVFAASASAFPATGAVGTLYVATTPKTIWYWSGSAYLPLGGSAGTLPGAPTNLTATTSSNRIDLTWTAPASSGSASITEYVIQYFNLDDSFGWTYSSTTYQSGTSAYIIGLINGNRYRLRVAAVTSVGIGDYVTTSGTFTP
jgi:hypothetical protein